MEIIRVKDAAEGGKKAFELIQQGVENGAKVLGLATGSTPETLYAEALSALHAELGASSYRLRLPGQTPFGMLRWAEGISSPPPDSLGYANLILD